jgi:oligoribonuclease NrnB/cAMP/cGMP phosphodiesterase (DHH superfamily)
MVNLDYNQLPAFIQDANNFVGFTSVVITDLNLKLEDAQTLDTLGRRYGFNLLLVDHHQSDPKCLEFPWYVVNTTMCATKLVMETMNANNEHWYSDEDMAFARLVNIYDTWKVDEFPVEFQKATFISDVVYGCPLVYRKREFIFQYFDVLCVDEAWDLSILDLEKHYIDAVYSLSQDNPVANYAPSKQRVIRFDKPAFIDHIKENWFTAPAFNGVKIVHTTLPSTNFQYLSHMATEDITEPVVMINASPKGGNASVRGNTEMVLEVAKHFGGGGHPKAGGFVIKDYNEFLVKLKVVKNLALS